MASNASGAHDWTQVVSALPWIHVTTAFISGLGSVSVLTWVTSQWRLGGAASELRPLLLLAASDLLLSLCGLLGGALLAGQAEDGAWYALSAATQVVGMMSFFYTLDYVWNAYARLRLNFRCVRHQLPAEIVKHPIPSANLTASLSGVLPLLLMAPVLARARIDGCGAGCGDADRCLLTLLGALPVTAETPVPACRLLRAYSGAVFLTAFFITLFGVSVLVGKCRQLYRRVVTSHGYLGNRQRVSLRALDLRLLAYSLILVVCWGPTAYLVATGSPSDVLYATRAVTSASPGVLRLAALTCARGSPTRDLSWRDADTQTPLLRAQRTTTTSTRPT
nr:transmembrane protein 116-like [Nerophis lumbriciformis]